VSEAQRLGLSYQLALFSWGNDGGIFLFWLNIARASLSSHVSILQAG
jgi:hypothetical protein